MMINSWLGSDAPEFVNTEGKLIESVVHPQLSQYKIISFWYLVVLLYDGINSQLNHHSSYVANSAFLDLTYTN